MEDYNPNEHKKEELFGKKNEIKENIKEINVFEQENQKDDQTEEGKYNNIIYYDENINFIKDIHSDSDLFEKNTSGAFILCTNENSFNLVKNEILHYVNKNKNNNKAIFNLIISGNNFEKVINFLNENKNFDSYISNYCIYYRDKNDYSHFKDKFPKLHEDIYSKRKEIIHFIYKTSSKDINPYPITKVKTFEDYEDKYKEKHIKISYFYGDLSPRTYQKYFKLIKELIREEENSRPDPIIRGFLQFEIKDDIESLDKLLIREYSKFNYVIGLNRWSVDDQLTYYEPIAYFISRLMFSLNSYANINNMYCKENGKIFFSGVKIPYTSLLPYERAIGKKIFFQTFTSTSEKEKVALSFSGRNNSKKSYMFYLKFSVIYHIINLYKNNWISNGINIQNESLYRNEKEFVFLPFSFYFVKDVKINTFDYTADIYLETIGKKEILEEQIQNGKEIEYNIEENIMKIKK